MATANMPPGMDNHNGADPFFTSSHDAQRQRYAAFDNSQFSLYLSGSPTQAKRALQAHLAETTRRLQETSHLGNALVQQRKELESKLHEVEQQHEENDIGPELRQRLAELEKEFNEVGRETARVFLPKSRAPSGEADTTTGASVYSTQGQQSPTKVSVPSRKQRNQQPSRINDVALATEISTSLLSQLKELQAVLLEKDEALKAADLDLASLQIEMEGMSQRLRTLDESESRLKDVNWNLETQVRESELQSKSAVDKEHRLNHALNLVRTEKSDLERDFEDLRQQYAKLNDDHINKTKQNETELASLRRNVAMTETEKNALQRKVEDLSNQNQDLAKAVAYRMKMDEQAAADDTSTDEGIGERDTQTPEHSPPPSPNKATPRHGILESETLKHSLQHAHRMIQQLKNNIHREKTEKIELKRMLQDARDELETNRGALNGPGSAGKRRKADKDIFKKPVRPDRLGTLRSGTQEILVNDDDEWEEQEGMPNTPSRRPRPDHVPGAFSSGFSSATENSTAEGFETANETSDAAFETANERDGMTTETDAFLTGAETLDGNSSDELTETEAGPSQATLRHSRSSLSKGGRRHESYESTASTSGDEFDEPDVRTPMSNQQARFRMKGRRSSSRKLTGKRSLEFYSNTTPVAKGSPASFVDSSRENTPAQGKSLFAELNDLSGDEDDSSIADEGTPSRSSALFSLESSPEALRASVLGKSHLQRQLAKPVMVDSGVMTDPEPVQPVGLSSINVQTTQPQIARPASLHLSPLLARDTVPQGPKQPSLRLSPLLARDTVPQGPKQPDLRLSPLLARDTAPQGPKQPDLRLSLLSAQDTTPLLVPPPVLHVSGVSGHATAPQEPTTAPLVLSSLSVHETLPAVVPVPNFTFSSLSVQGTAPQVVPSSPLNLSSVSAHTTEPRHAAFPQLGFSSLASHGTEPVAPVVENAVLPALSMSTVGYKTTEPVEGPATKVLSPALLASGVFSQSTEPKELMESAEQERDLPLVPVTDTKDMSRPPTMQLSNVVSHSSEPLGAPRPQLSTFSSVSSQVTEPSVAKREASELSKLSSHSTEPLVPQQQLLRASALTSWSMEPLTPRMAPLGVTVSSSQSTEPIELQKPRTPELSSVVSQFSDPLEPQKPRTPELSSVVSQSSDPLEPQKSRTPELSSVVSQSSDPLEPQKPVLSISSTVFSQASEPIESPRQPLPKLSLLPALVTEPMEPRQQVRQVSDISTQYTAPIEVPTVLPIKHNFSDVSILQNTQPELPTVPSFLLTPSRPSTANRVEEPPLMMSNVRALDTEPLSARPGTAHRAVPVLSSTASSLTQTEGGRRHAASSNPAFADPVPATSDMRMPFGSINPHVVRNAPPTPTADEGTQTMVSAEQIDKLLLARNQRYSGIISTASVEKALSPPPSPSRRQSNELRAPRRPGSSGSTRSRGASPPPLPPDHKEVIAAAAKSLPPVSPGLMGPPIMPASAYKKRPQTPSIKTSSIAASPRVGGTTPRARRYSQRGDAKSGASSPLSRRSSLSSFTSEVDQRFNITGGPSFAPNGVPPGATDPRMIQAITQTMIGEYLWKYTRKTGRGDLSENRHRRFFWIHPYTRTLYWSDRDPQTAGKTELKGKSVAIESVQEVEDVNPLPPGLHQKSLVIGTPGRSIKFTATTGQRHETWFNALNYLCQRAEESEQREQKPPANDEIQDEFNAGYGYRSSSRATGRSRTSMASNYTRRTSSPQRAQVSTLRQSSTTQVRSLSTEPGQDSMSRRFSNMLRPSSATRGSFSSRYSRASVQEPTTYEEPNTVNTDLGRDLQNQVERDLDNMVNVRACCDGKHDVGHLHMPSLKGRHSTNTVNSRQSLIGSLSSRSQSRNESRAESRTERIRHQTEMEAANSGAGY